jgi:hypothetical protein
MIVMSLCSVFFLFPNLSWAECTDIGNFNSFSLEGTHTVILYAGSMPVARFDIQNCDVQPSSKIQLIRTNVCDGDEILIDGKRCVMMDIKPIGP